MNARLTPRFTAHVTHETGTAPGNRSNSQRPSHFRREPSPPLSLPSTPHPAFSGWWLQRPASPSVARNPVKLGRKPSQEPVLFFLAMFGYSLVSPFLRPKKKSQEFPGEAAFLAMGVIASVQLFNQGKTETLCRTKASNSRVEDLFAGLGPPALI